jgi:RNA polymerase sigma-70 factor (ECF subfamily)
MASERSVQAADGVPGDLKMKDARLVALAKAGDDNAYAELVKSASPSALRAVRRILNAEADAEDALQEARINSYFKLSTFDGRAQFSTWFTRIAINSALMIRRQYRRRGEVTVTDDTKESDSMLMNIVDPRPNPLDVLWAKQEYEVLRHAIDSLPWSLKEGLQVLCKDDLSLRELAARLHLSYPAAKTRLFRAKRYVIARAGAHLISGHSRK